MKSSVLANTIKNPPTVLFFYFGMTFFFFVCVKTLHSGCKFKSFVIDRILVTVSLLPP